MKPTPGPWHAWNKGGDGTDPYIWEVAGPMHTKNHVVIADKLTEENARLVAAAPELFEAAKKAITYLELIENFDSNEAYKMLIQAIAKAEGN